MDMHRFPPDEHFNDVRQKKELTQARRLRAALELDHGLLEEWRWPIFSREVPYEDEKGRQRMTEIDALMWAPSIGFVILDFKTAKGNPKFHYEIDELFAKSWNQAVALWQWLRYYNEQSGLADTGFAVPPVLPIVGFLEGPNKKKTKDWTENRDSRGMIHVPGIGTEYWKDGSATKLAEHLHALVRKEMRRTDRYTTARRKGKFWTTQQATEWWETFQGMTRPARHFGDHLDAAIARSEEATLYISGHNANEIFKRMSDSEPLLLKTAEVGAEFPGEGRPISAGVVRGLAGTGKTWLAWSTALRLSAQGRKTLMLCRSERLVEQLNRDTEARLLERDYGDDGQRIRDNLLITSPHSLFKAASKGGMHDDYQLWNADHWGLIAKAHVNHFDAVLVDEAQDLGPLSNGDNPFIYLSGLLRSSESEPGSESGNIRYPMMLLFGDSGQNTAEAEIGADWSPPEGFAELLDLRVNLRSTLEIARTIEEIAGVGYEWVDLGYRDHEPRVRGIFKPGCLQPGDFWQAVNEELVALPSRLGHDNPNNPLPTAVAKRVAILCDDQQALSFFRRVSDQMSIEAKQGLTITTVDDYKGSESDIVFLVLAHEYEDTQSLKAIVYTGMSRARGELVVIHNQERLELVLHA